MTARTVAVVTGAGSPTGIGFATARALARAGHCILIVSTSDRIKDRAAELRAEGHEAHAVVADLTREPDIELLQEHAEALGEVSVLVNNAGMAVLGEMDALGNLEGLDLGRSGGQVDLHGIHTARPVRIDLISVPVRAVPSRKLSVHTATLPGMHTAPRPISVSNSVRQPQP